MANRLITEIGSDSSQFRQDVASLPGVVNKSFKDMGAASKEGGLAGTLESLKGSARELKEVFLAGGLVEIVKNFFETAIKTAEKSTDANDVYAASVRNFGTAWKATSDIGAEASVKVVGFWTRAGEAVGYAVRGVYDMITQQKSLFTVLDEGAKSENIIENAEQNILQIQKDRAKYGEAFKAVNESIAISTEQIRTAVEATRTPAEKISAAQVQLGLAMMDQLAAEEAGRDTAQKRLAIKQTEAVVAAATAELLATEVKEMKNSLDQASAGLEIGEKVRQNKEQITAIEIELAAHAVTGRQAQEDEIELAARKLILTDDEKKLAEQTAEQKKQSAADEKKAYDERDVATQKYAKAKFDELSDEEKIVVLEKSRADLLVYLAALPKNSDEYAKQYPLLAEIDKQIADILAGRQKTLVAEQQFEGLTRQQLQAKADLLAATIAQRTAEGLVTDELQKQLNIILGIIAKKTQANVISVTGSNIGGHAQGESTEALKGEVERFKKQLTQIGAHGEQIGNADQNADTGDWLTAQLIKSQLNTDQQELDLRNQIQAFVKSYGEDAALRQFGDADTQRALRDMTDVATRTSNTLTDIQQTLAKSPFFPS